MAEQYKPYGSPGGPGGPGQVYTSSNPNPAGKDWKPRYSDEKINEIARGKELYNKNTQEMTSILNNMGVTIGAPALPVIPNVITPVAGERTASSLGGIPEGQSPTKNDIPDYNYKMKNTKEALDIEKAKDPVPDKKKVSDPNAKGTTAMVTGKTGSNPDLVKRMEADLQKYKDESMINIMGKEDGNNYKSSWEQDDHFWSSSLRFFMNVLGGAPIGDAFMDAGNYYDAQNSKDKRAGYAEEMSGDYTRPSIEKWIATGDEKHLTSVHAADNASTDAYKKEQDAMLAAQKNAAFGQNQALKNARIMSQINADNARAGASRASALKSQIGEGGSHVNRTEAQGKAKLGYDSARIGNETWESSHLGEGDDYIMTDATSMIAADKLAKTNPDMIDSIMKSWSAPTKKAMTDERAFLKGVLRPESGAAISASEWANYGDIFFPRPDDTEPDLAKKAVMRQVAINSLGELGLVGTEDTEEGMARGKAIADSLGANIGNVTEYNRDKGAYKTSDGNWHYIK